MTVSLSTVHSLVDDPPLLACPADSLVPDRVGRSERMRDGQWIVP